MYLGEAKMPRVPKPWYRKDRESWFVTIAGCRHNLGPDKKEAFKQFYALMQAPEPSKMSKRGFAAIADAFLDWVKANRSPHTFEWYRYRLERFCQRNPTLLIADLKPFHVQQWVDSYTKLTRTTKRNYVRSVKRCCVWAKQQGYIKENPIAEMEVPGADRREVVLSVDDFATMNRHIPDPYLRQLCLVAFETGCRPQEILRVEARHVDAKHERWVLPVVESKGKKAPRIVYLTTETNRISQELVAKYPEGKLFRNSAGKPWTVSSVNCAFKRLQQRMGKLAMEEKGIKIADALAEELKLDEEGKKLDPAKLTVGQKRKFTIRAYCRHAPKYSLYALRHSWATRALRSDMDALTVAILMGHNDPSTLSKVYQHLAHSPEHMMKQARKAAGE
jgi:integrase